MRNWEYAHYTRNYNFYNPFSSTFDPQFYPQLTLFYPSFAKASEGEVIALNLFMRVHIKDE